MTWIFGYGSLIWRPDFAHLQAVPARAHGYVRRFWQGSPDHRGTPEQPGRVVTLVPQPGQVCHGVAFRVDPAELTAIMAYLDVRESGGYERLELALQLDTVQGATPESTIQAHTYIAHADNPNFCGNETFAETVSRIATAAGDSGHNRDYLSALAQTLRDWDIHDPHVFKLERAVASLLAQSVPNHREE